LRRGHHTALTDYGLRDLSWHLVGKRAHLGLLKGLLRDDWLLLGRLVDLLFLSHHRLLLLLPSWLVGEAHGRRDSMNFLEAPIDLWLLLSLFLNNWCLLVHFPLQRLLLDHWHLHLLRLCHLGSVGGSILLLLEWLRLELLLDFDRHVGGARIHLAGHGHLSGVNGLLSYYLRLHRHRSLRHRSLR